MNKDTPITKENFAEVWKHTDLLRRIARIKYQISRFATTVGHLAVLLPVLILMNGLVVENFPFSYSAMMKGLPLYNETWKLLNELAPAGMPLWAGTLLLAVGLGLAAFIATALVVVIFYHPFRRRMPEKSDGELAQLLVKLTRETRMYANRTHGTTSTLTVCAGACVVAVILSVILFMSMEDMFLLLTTISEVLGLEALGDQIFNMYQFFVLIYPVAFFVVYGLFDHVFGMIIRLIYGMRYPYDRVVRAQRYEVSLRMDLEGLSEEEAAEKTKAWAQETRDAALTLERQGGRKKAKEDLLAAAVLGDVSAMEHYARHCIIGFERESAMYWLYRFIKAGGGDWKTKWILFRLWIKNTVHATYLDRVAESTTEE